MATILQDRMAATLAAILEERSDNTPRMIYADLLDEQGDWARAEFIRLQCKNYACLTGCKKHKKEHERERSLLLNNWALWTPRQQDTSKREHSFEVILSDRWTYTGTPAVLFTRGFVPFVECEGQDWLVNARYLTGTQPIHTVKLVSWPGASFYPSYQDKDGWHDPSWRLDFSDRRHAGERQGNAVYPPSYESMLAAEWPRIRFIPP